MPRKPREPRKNPRKVGRPKKADKDKVRSLPVAQRRPLIMRERLKGYSPDEIARNLRLRPSTVRADLKKMAQEAEAETPSKVAQRDMQGARLELLWQAVQNAVEVGDYKAVQVALRILERQAKLYGLDVDPKAIITINGGGPTDWDALLKKPAVGTTLGFADAEPS